MCGHGLEAEQVGLWSSDALMTNLVNQDYFLLQVTENLAVEGLRRLVCVSGIKGEGPQCRAAPPVH